MKDDEGGGGGEVRGIRAGLSRFLGVLDRFDTFIATTLISALSFAAFYVTFKGLVLPATGPLPKLVYGGALALTLAAAVRDLLRRAVGVASILAGIGWLAALVYVIVAKY